MKSIIKQTKEISILCLNVGALFLIIAASVFMLTRAINYFTPTSQRCATSECQKNNPPSKNSPQNKSNNTSLAIKDSSGSEEGNLLELLSILSIFGGFLAYVFRVIVRQDMKNKTERTTQEMRHYTIAQSLKGLGLINYNRYLDTRKSDEDGDQEKAKNFLKKAEEHTKNALDSALEICKLKNSFDNKLILCILKNNMAWIIFTKKEKTRVVEALEYINYATARSEDYPKHAGEWQDTRSKILKWSKSL